MKNTLLLFLVLVNVLFVSCENEDNTGNTPDCEDIVCTQIFITLNVTVKDASGVVIPLDSFNVINVENNEDLTRELSDSELESARETGTYPLFGDEYVQRFQNESLTVVFTGFIDGDEVVDAEFIVSADCCHVLLLAGETDIVIDP